MDLNTATTEQLDSYRAAVAKKVNIDPLMLDFAWMKDPESGLKSRVLYAKRGVAELLRKDFNITVTNLTMSENNGYVAFIATASLATGRQEIAVGAAYLTGLKGDKIAHAVMTAQTRAVRRVTLQLVGGGILDETEVQGQDDVLLPSAASQALPVGSPVVFPPPTVAPSNKPGVDITEDNPMIPSGAYIVRPEPITGIRNGQGVKGVLDAIKAQSALESAPLTSGNLTTPVESSTLGVPASGTPVQTEMPVGQIDAAGNITPAEEKPKRTRKRRNAVTMSEPEVKEAVAATCPICGKTIGEHAFKNSELVCPPKVTQDDKVTIKSTTIAQTTVTTEAMAPQVPTPPAAPQNLPAATATPGPGGLNPNLKSDDEFKARLRVYSNDVLPKGGMLPTDGIGGITMKLRAYARKITGASDFNALTKEQWEVLFEELDTRLANSGPVALVKDINEALGVV